MNSPSARLQTLIAREIPPTIPLVLDPLSAKFAEAAGFEGLYLGGGSLGYQKAITEANLSLTQMSHIGLEITSVSSLPLILDGACGWGDPMHMRNTIQVSEAAGYAGIEIEDQLVPKRVHQHVDVEHLIPIELMVSKIEEAVAARRDPDFVIIARTNACRRSTDDIEEAVRRAKAYRSAGADLLLVLPKGPEQAREIGERIGGPLVYMMLGGVSSVGMTAEELGELGYRLIIDPTTPFYAVAKTLRLSYEALARGEADPTLQDDMGEVGQAIFSAIGLEELLEIERRTTERH